MLGLLSGELIFGGAYYWKEFCLSKWVGLDNKNCLKDEDNSPKQLKTASTNSPWAYVREGLFILIYVFIYLFIYFAFFVGGGGGGYHRIFTVSR